MSTEGQPYTVKYINETIGRGLYATRPLQRDELIIATLPDVSILYSQFTRSLCACCFRPCNCNDSSAKLCQQCGQHLLCGNCWGSRNGDQRMKDHAQECEWFCLLPKEVQQGDTDYLRFCLHYGACVLRGDMRLVSRIAELCSNEGTQSGESKSFCSHYARLITRTFGPKGYPIAEEALTQALLRTKCNTLGFPFSDSITQGWSLAFEICMVNHSCSPNCAITQAATGEMELRCLTSVPSGNELTISYVHMPDYQSVEQREEVLQMRYFFRCECPLCKSQRSSRP